MIISDINFLIKDSKISFRNYNNLSQRLFRKSCAWEHINIINGPFIFFLKSGTDIYFIWRKDMEIKSDNTVFIKLENNDNQ